MDVCVDRIPPPSFVSSVQNNPFYEPQGFSSNYWHLATFLQDVKQRSIETRKVLRVHFEVTEEVWSALSTQTTEYRLEKFIDVVYDVWKGEELLLLGNKDCQHWLVHRQYQDPLKKPEWKLRIGTRHESSNCHEIAWFELPSDKLVNYIKDLLHLSSSLESLFDICSPVLGLETTRICVLPNLWIDFSSWLNFGKFGAYVVGTSHISPERDLDLVGVKALFDSASIRPVASKYLACAFNTDEERIFNKILKQEEREIALRRLARYPVRQYVDPKGTFYKIHPYDKASLQNHLMEDSTDEDSE